MLDEMHSGGKAGCRRIVSGLMVLPAMRSIVRRRRSAMTVYDFA